jgi:Holliday junction DNA helicase RuvB
MIEMPKDKTPPDSYLSLSTFVGQEAIKQDLRERIAAAKRQSKPLPHMLLCGPPEIGKVTLAFAIAREMGVNIKISQAALVEKPGDLAALLTNLEEGDLLLLEQIESLREPILDLLVRAIEDFHLDIEIVFKKQTRKIALDLKRLV